MKKVKNDIDNIGDVFTRQINFYIIRAVYDIVNGYVTTRRTPENDFYCLLEISKSSYDKIVYNDGTYRSLIKKIVTWENKTGISKKIFGGEELFNIENIDLIAIRAELRKDGSPNNVKVQTKKIRESLKDAVKMQVKDINFKALIYFANKKRNVINKDNVKQKINKIINELKPIDLKIIQLLDKQDLDNYINFLEEQLTVIKAYKVISQYEINEKMLKKN